MPRHDFDKSSKWLIQHHGNALLVPGRRAGYPPLAGVTGRGGSTAPTSGRPVGGRSSGTQKPDYFLLEVATYPEPRVFDQALDSLMLAYQQLRQVPELLVVVLHPKGRFQVGEVAERLSRLGWSRLSGGWKVVELWAQPAEQLLATGDVGLIPWVPLMRFSGSPTQLLDRCRLRIEQQAPAKEQANLLAVS